MSERASWQVTTHDWSRGVDLDHLEGVRRRLSHGELAGGRRHLILEVLAYADEEAESLGRVGTTVVTYHPDGSVSVADDGRGTDTRIDSDGHVVRKPVMATPDVRFQDTSTAPVLPDGLPPRGMSTVAALSSVLIHTNHRRSGSWCQTYRYGIPDDELAPVEPRDASGTSVTFTAHLSGPSDLADTDLEGFPWLTIERVERR